MNYPQQRCHGFTLVEIIVVVALLSVLLTIVVFSGSDARSTANLTVADQDVQQFNLALQLYAQANDALPAGLSDLHPDYLSKDVAADPWGNAYVYQNNYGGGVAGRGSLVCSRGPDGTLDTDDAQLALYEAGGDDICRFIFDND